MKELQKEFHTLKDEVRMCGITAMGDLSHSRKSVLTRMVEGGTLSNSKLQEIVQNGVDELAAIGQPFPITGDFRQETKAKNRFALGNRLTLHMTLPQGVVR